MEISIIFFVMLLIKYINVGLLPRESTRRGVVCVTRVQTMTTLNGSITAAGKHRIVHSFRTISQSSDSLVLHTVTSPIAKYRSLEKYNAAVFVDCFVPASISPPLEIAGVPAPWLDLPTRVSQQCPTIWAALCVPDAGHGAAWWTAAGTARRQFAVLQSATV